MHRLPQSLKGGGALTVGKTPALQQGPQAATPVASASLSDRAQLYRAPSCRSPPSGRIKRRQSGSAALPRAGQGRERGQPLVPRRNAGHLPLPLVRGNHGAEEAQQGICRPPPRSTELSSRSICRTASPSRKTNSLFKAGRQPSRKGPPTRIRHRPPLLAPYQWSLPV